jgi:hypothetical protein
MLGQHSHPAHDLHELLATPEPFASPIHGGSFPSERSEETRQTYEPTTPYPFDAELFSICHATPAIRPNQVSDEGRYFLLEGAELFSESSAVRADRSLRPPPEMGHLS